MNNILGIGRSGLKANQLKMDVLADEVANVNTNGYKKDTVSFRELLPTGDTSAGTRAAITRTDHSQGILRETGNQWDLAIEGDGFFGVHLPDGTMVLTRAGAFTLNEDGTLTSDKGLVTMTETPDGFNPSLVSVTAEGDMVLAIDGERETIGHLTMYFPQNLNDLIRIGDGMFIAREDSVLIDSRNMPEQFGNILSGFLEESNSDLTKALTDMIVAQRSYSLNAEAVRSTDDLMRIVNDLKR
ncbi:MAG: flagellar hook-basal body protein [Gudongella sp.]|jgi:flagellar basal-body rod protein FlgG|nr:flagellar hook-basal body protein [Gudongella sp.]